MPKKLDVSKLKQDSKRQAFVNDLCSRLDALEHSSEDVAKSWAVFRDTIHSSAMDSLGPVSRKHRDWFHENDIQGLLEEKHQKHKAYRRNTSSVSSKTAYLNLCKTVQTRLRDMQDSWLSKKADEIQSFADRKDMKKFFDALKTIYGPQSSGTTPILSAYGTSLQTDKEAILSNTFETVKAINLLSSGKFPGSDAIPAEIYKVGGPPGAKKLTELFHIMWRKEAIPQEFKDATIIHLFKRKGNPHICDNHRGISLLSVAGKILARVLWNRLNEHLERSGLVPESQCGFRKNRGTIDMIFTARQLQEKCQEQNVDLYMTFVDLTKAFDSQS